MNFPQNNKITSEFEAFWKPFTRVFQAFCVSNYCIFRPNLCNNLSRSFMYLVYFLILSILHIAIVASATSRGLECEQKHPEHRLAKHRESALMYYVNTITTLGGLATHVATHLETLLNGKHEEEIYQKLRTINAMFVTKLNHATNFKTRSAKNIRQTVVAFVLSTLLASASSFTTLPDLYHDKYFMQPILIFAVIINQVRWCYIAIVLNVLADILSELHILLKQQQIQSCDNSNKQSDNKFARENIRYFRDIYSNVWFIVTLMSNCFGWSLISFLIEFSLESINAAYWLYINLSVYKSIHLNIRKFL